MIREPLRKISISKSCGMDERVHEIDLTFASLFS